MHYTPLSERREESQKMGYTFYNSQHACSMNTAVPHPEVLNLFQSLTTDSLFPAAFLLYQSIHMAEYMFAIMFIFKNTCIHTCQKAYNKIMSNIGSMTPKDSTLMQKKKSLFQLDSGSLAQIMMNQHISE